MNDNQSKKVRLSVDCSIEERRLIRTLAAHADKSVPQYLLALIRKEFQSQGLDQVRSEIENQPASHESAHSGTLTL